MNADMRKIWLIPYKMVLDNFVGFLLWVFFGLSFEFAVMKENIQDVHDE